MYPDAPMMPTRVIDALPYRLMHDYATIPVGAGALLVAAPSIVDPNFARTVVQVLHHDADDGTLGVIINRPRSTQEPALVGALGEWLSDSAPPHRVFEGGPVSPDSFLCLTAAAGGVRSVDLTGESPETLSGPWRVFRGYSGWAPGQLDDEIGDAGWYVVASEPHDIFDPEPLALWRTVLSRQSGILRRFADFPEDPSVN